MTSKLLNKQISLPRTDISRIAIFITFFVGLLSVQGCADFTDMTQPDERLGLGSPVSGQRNVGQTFVARHAGLKGIRVFAAMHGPPGDGTAVLYLRSDPRSRENIAEARLKLTDVIAPGWYTFSFRPIDNAHGKRFYFLIESLNLPRGSSLIVGQSQGTSYDDGSMYRSGKPIDRQLTFALVYSPLGILRGVVTNLLEDLKLAVACLLLFLLPGWALLTLMLPRRMLSFGERLGLSAGLGLAVYPLMFLWARVAGIRPGALAVWATIAVAGVVLAYQYRHLLRQRVVRWLLSRPKDVWPPARLLDVAYVLTIALVLESRLFVVHGYDIPFWGDSVQHTTIAQLILNNKGLFDSWMPYAAFDTLTVHFGFHIHVAALTWLIGGESTKNTMIMGQIVNFISVLVLVPLACKMIKTRWCGLGVLLFVGFITPTPMEYVNWGRYAQLTGQALLPIAVWLTWDLFDRQALRMKTIFLLSIVITSMCLSYYRSLYYYGAFVAALVTVNVFFRHRCGSNEWRKSILGLLLVSVIASILLLPWLYHIRQSDLALSLGSGEFQGVNFLEIVREYGEWKHLYIYVSEIVVVLSAITVAFAIYRRIATVAVVSLWCVGMILLAGLRLVGIISMNYMNNFAIMIAMYIPCGLLSGYAVDKSIEVIYHRRRILELSMALTVVAAMLTIGGRKQIAVIDQSFRLVAPADEAAMEWIRKNTAEDAVFVVEGFPTLSGASVVGGDAGWWIPLLAGRRNTMPPQYALLNERPMVPGYEKRVVELVRALREFGVASKNGLDALCSLGVTHAYVGQVYAAGDSPYQKRMLSLEGLERSGVFQSVYREDKVGVFKFRSGICVTRR